MTEQVEGREPAVVTVQTMLKAGVHFGHQSSRWNPKMIPYIYGERSNIHIINLDLTLKLWERARKAIVDVTSSGGRVLFVGTKKQAREIIRQESERSESFCVTTRWLGGTLTNFQTIKNSIERMRKVEELLEKAAQEDSDIRLNKKERLHLSRELEKLNSALGGIREMKKPPDLLFVVDVAKESIAVAEARKLRIPVVALVDTNSCPDDIEYVIPSNDDASRTIRLFAAAVADAVIEGKTAYTARFASHAEKKGKQEQEEATGKAAEEVIETAAKANGNEELAKDQETQPSGEEGVAAG